MNTTTIFPVICQPWCEGAASHPDEACAGPSHVVQLSTEAPIDGRPHELEVYQWQELGAAVQVHLSHDGAAGPALTLAEVARLRDELQTILSMHGADALKAA